MKKVWMEHGDYSSSVSGRKTTEKITDKNGLRIKIMYSCSTKVLAPGSKVFHSPTRACRFLNTGVAHYQKWPCPLFVFDIISNYYHIINFLKEKHFPQCNCFDTMLKTLYALEKNEIISFNILILKKFVGVKKVRGLSFSFLQWIHSSS